MTTAINPQGRRAFLRVDADGNLLISGSVGGGGGGGGGGSADTSHLLPKTGGTMTGNLVMSNNARITGLPLPQSDTDPVTKAYVEEQMYPRTLCIVRYTNCQAGAVRPQGPLFPLATLVTNTQDSIRNDWPRAQPSNNFTLLFPWAGTYMIRILPDAATAEPVYLADANNSFDGLLGPSQESEAIPLGAGMTCVVGVKTGPALVRIPIAAPGTARKALPDLTIIVTYLAPKE